MKITSQRVADYFVGVLFGFGVAFIAMCFVPSNCPALLERSHDDLDECVANVNHMLKDWEPKREGDRFKLETCTSFLEMDVETIYMLTHTEDGGLLQ